MPDPYWHGYPQGNPHPYWHGYPQGNPHPHWDPYNTPGTGPASPGYAAPSFSQETPETSGAAANPEQAPDQAKKTHDKDFISEFIKSPIPSISTLLGMDEMDFWKGALLGAAAVVLISGYLGQNDD